jgi:hypothetical protein
MDMFYVYFETLTKEEEGNHHNTTTEENTAHAKRFQRVCLCTTLDKDS